ncbi:MAG: D-alanine--D-alanine ligase [Acetobacteraceae bacterium]|nr:D-alanine--D-alanine ligase [Acetobacteraceae bacterium]
MKLETALCLGGTDAGQAAPPIVSFFEFWPGWLFYSPIVAHWILLGLGYGDFSLPTVANPHIPLGGLCGESKLAILAQVNGECRELLAQSAGFTPTGHSPEADLAGAEDALSRAGLSYPIVVKPDIGCNGTGVRLVADSRQLSEYLAAFPPGERVMLQEFCAEEGEAGLFYVRSPGAARGAITSITLKFPPFVTGDGRSTLRQLILADPRAGRISHLYSPRLESRLNEVPAQGERVRLVFVGNHCKGAIFQDGTSLATEALIDRIEALARSLPEFHFGRIDVRYASLAELLRGENFRVIEINGVGSEATHIWDPATSLFAAWKAQFFHYGQAFRIGNENRRRGFRPSGVWAMLRHWRRQRRLMASYPIND